MLITILIYIFIAYGLSNMLVYSSGPFRLFEYYRQFMDKLPSNLGEGAKCMICTPCQIGIILYLMDCFLLTDIQVTPFETSQHWYVVMFLNGFFSSGVVWFIHTMQEYFEIEEI